MKIASEYETTLAIQGGTIVGKKMWLLEFTGCALKGSEKRPYDGVRGLEWCLVTVRHASLVSGGVHVKHDAGEDMYPCAHARLAV